MPVGESFVLSGLQADFSITERNQRAKRGKSDRLDGECQILGRNPGLPVPAGNRGSGRSGKNCRAAAEGTAGQLSRTFVTPCTTRYFTLVTKMSQLLFEWKQLLPFCRGGTGRTRAVRKVVPDEKKRLASAKTAIGWIRGADGFVQYSRTLANCRWSMPSFLIL